MKNFFITAANSVQLLSAGMNLFSVLELLSMLPCYLISKCQVSMSSFRWEGFIRPSMGTSFIRILISPLWLHLPASLIKIIWFTIQLVQSMPIWEEGVKAIWDLGSLPKRSTWSLLVYQLIINLSFNAFLPISGNLRKIKWRRVAGKVLPSLISSNPSNKWEIE